MRQKLLPADWFSNLAVELPAARSRGIDGGRRFGLGDVFVCTLGDFLFPYTAVLNIVAEAFLMLRLLVMGVNVERWHEQAATIGSWPGSGRKKSNTC